MIALLVIFILIFVLSIINIIYQIVNIIDCSKSENVTVVKIKYMKNKYRINYVGDKNELLSFEVEASNWEELKLKIDEALPNDTKYLVGIHYVKTTYTEVDLR